MGKVQHDSKCEGNAMPIATLNIYIHIPVEI